jgi:hypothetical protein
MKIEQVFESFAVHRLSRGPVWGLLAEIPSRRFQLHSQFRSVTPLNSDFCQATDRRERRVMNASDYINVLLAVCRLIFYLLEHRKTRRSNGGSDEAS